MPFRNILVTGGAGFVGSHVAVALKRCTSSSRVMALDNLKRRGSELSLPRLRENGVEFVHGDIRSMEDFDTLGEIDLIIDCAAEPSVMAGVQSSPRPVVENNLTGTINLLELARLHQAAFLFMSTSRVYPMPLVNGIAYEEADSRFRWTQTNGISGFSPRGVAEAFPLSGARSLYGATKLAGEVMAQEYSYQYQLPVLINRCGVLAGPWQMGKVDQGVVALWVARHAFEQPLRYTGWGGQGKQVRDLLHVEDLAELMWKQMHRLDVWDGRAYNVGGGLEGSVSLQELTLLCRDATGRTIPIAPQPETNSVDVRIYISDTRRVQAEFDWKPTRTPDAIVRDVSQWIEQNRTMLATILK
jgi:CDP-paratose 2-epimerase